MGEGEVRGGKAGALRVEKFSEIRRGGVGEVVEKWGGKGGEVGETWGGKIGGLG